MQDQAATGYELSPVQEQLYRTLGDAALAPCQSVFRIDGPLDIERLGAAVDRLVERHEILRTNFCQATGRRSLLQVVRPAAAGNLACLDLSADPSDDAVARAVDAIRNEPVDRESGKLARFQVLQLGAERFRLVVTLSSLCGDLRALHNIADELLALYAGDEAGDEPLQYADFSAWQRDNRDSDEDDAQQGRRYWQEHAVAPSAESIPYERRVAGDDAPARVALDTAGADESQLLAAWVALLARATRRDDGVLALSADGRNLEEIAGLPGRFSRTIPLAWSAPADVPFAELAARLAAARADALLWQDWAPLEILNENPTPGYAVEPAYEARPVAGLQIAEAGHSAGDGAPLTLVCAGSSAALRYNAGKIADDDARRLAEQLSSLLAAALAAPQTAIGDLPVLSESERALLLGAWNDTAADYPREATIHGLFAAQAARTPDAPALVCGDARLSYAQLNQRANRIAHYLLAQGVAPNQPVALCAERSADMIVGLLAVLKAGGCYVPIASDLPAARVQGFLAQTGARIALTQSPLTSLFDGWDGAVASIDDAGFWAAQPETDPVSAATADDMAYILFTSGSTGVPKGVGNKHRGLVNYASFIAGRIGLSGDNPLHLATVSTLGADLGNTAVYPALLFGGCLHVIEYETAMDGQRFARYVAQNPLDLLKITPSHLSALLSASDAPILPRRFLFLGGEALRWDLLETVRSRGGCEVVNHYGPTETTIGSLTYTTSTGAVTPEQSATVPIGRPIANTRIYLLDARRQPVPVGVPGELYIGGDGLAAGYVGQPELTAEKFVADPFAGGDARMYRTGDLARYLPGGDVEFLGRCDDQVKIRGFRVEPGEIESVLRQHASVRDAVVLVADDNQGGKRLVGYYVAHTGDSSPESVRALLMDQLPDYMVPASLTRIGEVPLNANGKIDRSALLALESIGEAVEFVAGRNETEVKLAEIWATILKVERVGIHDDFFALGGHSLLMTQILARIHNAFQVHLPLNRLFDHPTVAGLAGVIDSEQTSGSEDEEMSRLLAELEGLSEDEVAALLSESSLA